MRGAARGSGYLYAAMLAAAVSGRVLDAGALLPGVRETASVRGGLAGWVTAVSAAAVVAHLSALRWSRTGSLRAVATVVWPGQVATFFAAEAAVRLAHGLGPLDADGLVGAGLQAALALLLLLTMTAAWIVAVHAAAMELHGPTSPSYQRRRRTTELRPFRPAALLLARGPPSAACT